MINEYFEGKGGKRALAKKYGLIPSTIKYWLDTRGKDGKLIEYRKKHIQADLRKNQQLMIIKKGMKY